MKKSAVVFGLFVWFAAAGVHAAPSSVSFAGRLSTANGPVNGAVNVTFSIFNVGTGGSSVWTDSIALTADQGLVFATLGRTNNELDETVFTGGPMFLEIVVQGETLSPRLPINSTPYAVRSTSADSADLLGTIAPGDVVTTITGSSELIVGGSGNTVSLSIDSSKVQSRVTNSCSAGTSIRAIAADGTVTCEGDDDTKYTAGAGINVTGTTVALTTCPAGQLLKSTGTGYSCQADIDTTYSAAPNGGVIVNGENQIGLLTTCSAGQVLKAGATPGTWACAPDASTTYVGGNGISISGTTVSLDAASCATGSVWKFNGTSFACVPDSSFANCARAVASGSSSSLEVSCPAGKYAISGGCTAGSFTTTDTNRPLGPPANGTPITGVGGWSCEFTIAGASNSAYALCCAIQ